MTFSENLTPIGSRLDAPLYVSIAEACRITSLSKSSIYSLMAEGKIDYIKVGKRRLIVRASLEQLAERLMEAV